MNKTKVTVEPGKQDLFIEREFNAPKELVFKAYTDADILSQWLGPKGYKMDVLKFEPKNGGSWKYIHEDESGNKYGFHGVFHEVLQNERIIQTFEFEGLPESGHVTLETCTFEDLPEGRSKIVGHSVFLSVEDRDGMVASGMEKGVVEGYERLDEVLENLNK